MTNDSMNSSNWKIVLGKFEKKIPFWANGPLYFAMAAIIMNVALCLSFHLAKYQSKPANTFQHILFWLFWLSGFLFVLVGNILSFFQKKKDCILLNILVAVAYFMIIIIYFNIKTWR